MSENKRGKLFFMFLMFLPEIGCMLAAVSGIYLLEYKGIIRQGTDHMLCDMVLTALGIAVVGYALRMGVIRQDLDYDNAEHWGRFWFFFLAGLAVAFACAFLPEGAWPFLAVFAALGIFGSQGLGTISGAVLLAIPVLLAGKGIEIYGVYLVSGVFGITLFGHLKRGMKIGRFFLLSLGCLFVCVTAGTVLIANARPDAEQFLVPVVNVVVSGLLLFAIVKYFSGKVVYQYRENYLDLNDSENELLRAIRQEDKSRYMRIVHITHFCERIALRIGLDQDALKCAGYYHSLQERLPGFARAKAIPPEVTRILEDYSDEDSPVHWRETAVLIASRDVVDEMLRRIHAKEQEPIEYDKVIDEIFARYEEAGFWNECDISVKDLLAMQKIFKEEKLYYDFLR